MSFIIVIALFAIVAALVGAGLMMLRKRPEGDTGSSPGMARALAIRVGISIALFLFILLAWRMGWISPTGIPVSA